MKKIIFLLAIILIFYGCPGKTPTAPEVPDPPTISSFVANPSEIFVGDKSTLSWNVSNATSVSINQEIGTVSSSGSQEVSPTVTTTYTLTVSNSDGTLTKNCIVTVKSNPPTINSFTATPSEIFLGNKSTLSWDVSNATSVSIDQEIGTVSNSSTQEVSPTTTTTYTLTATNDGGSVTKSCEVTVDTSLPKINQFKATPSSIKSGEKSELYWYVKNATSVVIDNGIGVVGENSNLIAGTYKVSPASTKTYTLTATNDGGSVTKSCEVTVDTSLPKINEFKATPSSINSGEKSELYWHVENADKVVIDNGIGVVGENSDLISDTRNVSPTTSTTYKLTATNNAGSNTRSLVVTVLPASTTVYITKTGAKYHLDGCQYLSQSKIQTTLAQACKDGYTPCSVCKPPNCPTSSKTNIK